MTDYQKPKLKVAAPYSERKSREYEVVPPDPVCKRCGGNMSYIETEIGELKLWCYYCKTY